MRFVTIELIWCTFWNVENRNTFQSRDHLCNPRPISLNLNTQKSRAAKKQEVIPGIVLKKVFNRVKQSEEIGADHEKELNTSTLEQKMQWHM